VSRCSLLKSFHLREELLRCLIVLHIRDEVWLCTYQLICLGHLCDTAITDHLFGDIGSEGVSAHTREGVTEREESLLCFLSVLDPFLSQRVFSITHLCVSVSCVSLCRSASPLSVSLCLSVSLSLSLSLSVSVSRSLASSLPYDPPHCRAIFSSEALTFVLCEDSFTFANHPLTISAAFAKSV
jgi:hypothetical protein